MKIWKRNAIIASVLLLVCAGAYLNWSRAQKSDATDLTETLSAEQVMGEDTDRKSTRLNSSHNRESRMPSSA